MFRSRINLISLISALLFYLSLKYWAIAVGYVSLCILMTILAKVYKIWVKNKKI